MPDPLETPSEVDGELLGRVADEVAERMRRGERPDLYDYARRHPRIARLILEGIPLLEMIGPRPATPSDPERLGEYQILRLIGRGGMGAVYEAREPALNRSVALKVLAAGVAAEPSAIERFHREARAVALLHHTNIVPVFAVGDDSGAYYFAMQLIRGCSLRDAIGRESVLGRPGSSDYWRNAARVGLQVAEGLAHAHERGVIHRDVKPSNILLDETGSAWLTDFGLAKVRGFEELTRAGEVIGTLRFLAPECFRGKADARADVYGLGMTLYELVTRQPAFGESDRERLLWQVAHADPPRPRSVDPNVPRDLETVIRKASAKEPDGRYTSAREMADDLRRFIDGQPIAARRTTTWEVLHRWARRNPLPAGLTACVVLLLTAMAVGATLTALRLNDRNRQISENLNRAVRAEVEARAASDRELEAKRSALRRAWEALLSEAALIRAGPSAGRRAAALARLEEASELLPQVPHDRADIRRLRDLLTATLLTPDLVPGQTWERPASGTRVLAFDHSGRSALGTIDGEVRVHRSPDQPPEWIGRTALDGAIFSAGEFSPDGEYFAVLVRWTTGPARLVVWRTRDSLPGLDLPDVTASVFSPDSRLLACIRADRSVSFFRLADGIAPVTGPANLRAARLAFAPDGERYASLAGNPLKVVVRRTTTHESLHSFPVPEPTVTGLDWHSDGRHVIVSTASSIHVCDIRTGAVVQKLTSAGGFDRSGQVSISGAWLAAAGADGMVRVWETGLGGEASVTSPVALPAAIRHATFAGPDLIAYQVNAWQRFHFEPAANYRRLGINDAYEPLPAAMPNDGRWLAIPAAATTTATSFVHLWDLVDGTAVTFPTGPGSADAVLGEPDGTGLYVLNVEAASARLRRWPVERNPRLRVGAPVEVPLPAIPNFVARGGLTLSPDGRFVALAGVVRQPVPASLVKDGAADHRLFRAAFITTSLSDLHEGKWSGPLGTMHPMGVVHSDPVPKMYGRNRLALAPNALCLAIARTDAPAPVTTEPARSVFWDLSGTTPTAANARYPDARPRQVVFSPDGRWLVEGTRSEYHIRSPGTWDVVAQLPGDPNHRRSSPAAFSSDGRLLAVVRSRREVTLYRTGTWDEVASLPMRQDDALHWLAFASGEDRLVAVSTAAVHVWDLAAIRSQWRKLGVDAE
jgi:serine/threonine protein kinase/WD40 repeat protein